MPQNHPPKEQNQRDKCEDEKNGTDRIYVEKKSSFVAVQCKFVSGQYQILKSILYIPVSGHQEFDHLYGSNL